MQILHIYSKIVLYYKAGKWICDMIPICLFKAFSLHTMSEIAAYNFHFLCLLPSFCITKHTYESGCVYCDCFWFFLAVSSTIYLITLWIIHLNLLYMQVQSKWSLLLHPIFLKKCSYTINHMRSLPTHLWLLNVVCVGTRPLDFIMECMHVKVVR